MPWHVAKPDSCPASKPYGVIKDSDGSVVACHESPGKAKKQLAALYASESVKKRYPVQKTRQRREPLSKTAPEVQARAGEFLQSIAGVYGDSRFVEIVTGMETGRIRSLTPLLQASLTDLAPDTGTAAGMAAIVAQGAAQGAMPEQIADRLRATVGLPPREAIAVVSLAPNAASLPSRVRAYADRLLSERAMRVGATTLVDYGQETEGAGPSGGLGDGSTIEGIHSGSDGRGTGAGTGEAEELGKDFDPSEPRDEFGRWTTGATLTSQAELREFKGKLEAGSSDIGMDVPDPGLDSNAPSAREVAALMEANNPDVNYANLGGLYSKCDTAEDFARTVANQWHQSSGDSKPESVAIQIAIAEQLGTEVNLPVTSEEAMQGALNLLGTGDTEEAMRTWARAQYSATQEYLDQHGIEKVPVVRGLYLDSMEKTTSIFPGIKSDWSPMQIAHQPVSSWSLDQKVSSGYASQGNTAILVQATVPADRIFGMAPTGIGDADKSEIVVLDGPGVVQMKALPGLQAKGVNAWQ